LWPQAVIGTDDLSIAEGVEIQAREHQSETYGDENKPKQTDFFHRKEARKQQHEQQAASQHKASHAGIGSTVQKRIHGHREGKFLARMKRSLDTGLQ